MKLCFPPPRAKIVLPPSLIEQLKAGLSSDCKLTLISASAGFGKTTLPAIRSLVANDRLPGCRPSRSQQELQDHKHTMNQIYIPTSGVEDWRRLLADPEKHWRTGFSARSLAYAWENAGGFPVEIQDLFTTSDPPFQDMELLFAIPEHKVLMPPYAGHPSQNDLFVLARNSSNSLITITVEGKVSETFDKNLSEWNREGSRGKETRLAFIKEKLGLTLEVPPGIRYQLLHRTASAILEAERFTATSAMMIVHSFSQNNLWFEDYQAFLRLYGIENAVIGKLYFLQETAGIKLFSGWARGNELYLKM